MTTQYYYGVVPRIQCLIDEADEVERLSRLYITHDTPSTARAWRGLSGIDSL